MAAASSDGFVWSMTHVPGDEERRSRSAGMDALKVIESKLEIPDAETAAAVYKVAEDYPVIHSRFFRGSWSARDSFGRQVFCVDGKPYFRRYNDNWNPCVIWGSVGGGNVSWNSDVGDTGLAEIARAI